MKKISSIILLSVFVFGCAVKTPAPIYLWELDGVYLSNWKTIDTINYNPIGCGSWVYSEIKNEPFKTNNENPSNIKYQKRVNGKGIIQEQTQSYNYIKFVPKSPYEIKIDSLKNISL